MFIRRGSETRSDIDDIAQATYARFVESPPDPIHPTLPQFQAQLALTAYHLMETAARTSKRRMELLREKPVDDEDHDSPHEIAARAEDYERIRQALGALSEHDRELLEATFRDGDPLSVVSTVTQTPKSTVHERLHRAKLRLLARLLLWVLAAAVFAGSVYLASRLLTGSKGSGVTEQPPPTHTPGEPPREEPAPVPALDAEESLPAGNPAGTHVEDPSQVVHGLVLDASTKSPLPEARCRLVENSVERGVQFVRSDPRGRFSFAPTEGDVTGTLYVRADGYAIRVEELVRAELREVELEPEHVLRGIVLNADGTPAVGAPIRVEGTRIVDHGPGSGVDPPDTWLSGFAYFFELKTDREGKFLIHSLYSGEFTITAYRRDDFEFHASARRTSHPPDARVAPVIIELPD